MDNAISIGPSKDAASFDEFTCPKCGGSKPSCCSCPTPSAPAKQNFDSLLKERARRVVEETPRGTLNGLELLIERVAAFADEVRNEAATAALEQAAQIVREHQWHSFPAHELHGGRKCAEIILEEIAAIGDDKEHLQ